MRQQLLHAHEHLLLDKMSNNARWIQVSTTVFLSIGCLQEVGIYGLHTNLVYGFNKIHSLAMLVHRHL